MQVHKSRPRFFRCISKKKNIVLYSGQYGKYVLISYQWISKFNSGCDYWGHANLIQQLCCRGFEIWPNGVWKKQQLQNNICDFGLELCLL